MINRGLRKVARETSLLESSLSYKWRMFQHIKKLPALSPIDRHIVEALRKEGAFITSLEALSLPMNEKLWDAAKAILPNNPKEPAFEDQYVYHVNSAKLIENSEIFLWGLQERLLDIAENYLSVPVAYRGLFFQKDFANEQQVYTRLWHKDPEDHRLVKIAVYLNDVDSESGPFEYIPKHFNSKLSSLKRKLLHSDAEVAELVEASNWVSCTGVAGTVIFFDPHHVFHRGKLPTKSHRDAIFFNYHSRQPIKVFSDHWNAPFSTDELLVLSKTLSQRQKECVFWWENGSESFQPKLMLETKA
jgi:Phytanoyl-CoA dioxygenase (PhyH)